MSRAKSVKKLEIGLDALSYDLFAKYHRRIIYLEMIEPRFSSMHDAIIHFYLLNDGKMQEFEICYADSAEFYHSFVGFMDRYVYADVFRNYRFQTQDFAYRVLIHKGATLDSNNDLGGFVFQNNKTSHLISPYKREIFERLRDDLLNYSDGVAQLVRVGLLLKNEKFCQIHDEFFGRIGVAGLKDGSIVKYRYADSVANNSVITDQDLFREYLECVNTIPMSDFTAQSVISKLAEDYHDTKQVLMENYSNFLFADEDEIEFASMLLGLFLHRSELSFTSEEWITGISYIKYLNNDTFLRTTESELGFKRNLGLYRANYVLDKVPLPKLVHFIYDFFEYKNLSKNICAFYPRLNALLGEDIREKYAHLETINVSLKSYLESKHPTKFFEEPMLVNFSTAADKEICKQIISGKYNHDFATFYLCNYMQVADYKRYGDVLPAVLSIIKNLSIENDSDYNLFWMACDVLNEFWKLIPNENEELQAEIEKLVYEIFWPRVGDIWPIEHRNELSFNDEYRAKAFKESLGWVLCLDMKAISNRKLKKYLNEKIDRNVVNIEDVVDKKRYGLSFKKQKQHSVSDFVGENANENEWCYAAIYCDEVSDAEILKSIIDNQCPLLERLDTARYALEQLFLKVRSKKSADELYKTLLDNFDEVESFFDRIENDEKDKNQLEINLLMALCESATGEYERSYINKLAKKMLLNHLDRSFEEKVSRAITVAEARMRQTKFQTKNITVDFIKKLR